MSIDSLLITCCLMFAVCAAAAAWSLRHGVLQRIDRDTAWLDEARRTFAPNPTDSRRYVLIVYAVMFAVVLPLFVLVAPVPFLGLLLWLLLWLAPQQISDWCWRRRLAKIDDQLPASIHKFAGLCSAGLSLADALAQLAAEAPYPLRYEYQIMSNSWRLGTDLTTVVGAAFQRLRLESFRLFYVALTTNNELGGNLVATLMNIGDSLNAQLEMKKEIDAALSEGKMNIYGLLAAPPVMMLIITIMDPAAVVMFFSTELGWGMFGAAMLFIGAGVLWAWRIAKIEA